MNAVLVQANGMVRKARRSRFGLVGRQVVDEDEGFPVGVVGNGAVHEVGELHVPPPLRWPAATWPVVTWPVAAPSAVHP